MSNNCKDEYLVLTIHKPDGVKMTRAENAQIQQVQTV